MTAAAFLPRCTFPPPGSRLVCAVSGGPDSTALLALAVAAGCDVTAVHVDHGLRDGSAAEADVVAANASRLGAAFESRRVVVAPGPDLEARARAARYAVLPADVATGHTADDRAETVLLNLMRGAGLDGSIGIRAGLRHPILDLRRLETEALCATLGLAVVRDPSNFDPRHRRNRVRHEVLPLLDDVAERDVAAVVARAAAHAADDAELLESLAAGVDPMDCAALRSAPAPLARRAVRGWLRRHLGGHPPDAPTVDRVLAVAAGDRLATDVRGELEVRRSSRRLRLARRGDVLDEGLSEAAPEALAPE